MLAWRALRTAEFVACVMLAVAMIFGGGSRGLGDAVVCVATLPVAVALCTEWRWSRLPAAARAASVLLLIAVAWHLIQLVPVPVSWFAEVPMRSAVLTDLQAAGVSNAWRPMTLDVVGTIRSLQSLVVFNILLGLLLLSSTSSRLRLIKIAVAIACATALLGYAQAAAGALSPVRLYEYHHSLGAIGTFANRNHFACLMAMSVPLSLALAAQAGERRAVEKAIWSAVAVMLLLAAGLSFSRTGFLLACASALISLVCLVKWRSRAAVAGMLIAVASIGAISVFAWHGLKVRLEQDPLQDLRWQYLRSGLEAARAYFPWGSGPGSFPYVYAPFEPISKMREVFALHAHNDFLEVALESGVVGVVLIVALLGIVAMAVRNKLIVVRDRSPILVGSIVAVSIPILHSLVDYPLRTYAVTAMFALVLSVVLSATDSRAGGEA